jgi:hypothetical protein
LPFRSVNKTSNLRESFLNISLASRLSISGCEALYFSSSSRLLKNP